MPSTASSICMRSRFRVIRRYSANGPRVSYAQLLAAGIDPQRATLFVQSDTPRTANWRG